MSCSQVSAYWACGGTLSQSSYLHASSSYAFPSFRCYKAWPRLGYSVPKYHRSPLCLFGGKGKSEDDKEASAWSSLEKAMGDLRKGPSVQDILRQQMEEEFSGDGGSGSPPGKDGDGSGGSEEENLASILDELLQVILATIALILLYIYMLGGEDMTRLARDYIKYLFGVRASQRLRRAMRVWGRFRKSRTRKKVVRKDWLERAIVSTPTWWHDPRQSARLVAAAD